MSGRFLLVPVLSLARQGGGGMLTVVRSSNYTSSLDST